jgi:diaminohydroxyphosphoribosylaminopyrimidine deaminase/5-amino-6-(5-phosphoribosylamino)uracil reductase
MLAERGWGRTAPNPLVGAVVVRDGKTVGEGFHAGYGLEHAEAMALRAAGESARGATLYVTLEPCNHTDKTPPCSELIVKAGVSRVVFAAGDPNRVAAGGSAYLRKCGVAIDVGVEEREALELNAPFFNRFRSDRPWTTLKLAMSIDGAIADHLRSPGWLSSEESRRAVHRMRAGANAIGVGLGTVLADDPALTVRGSGRTKPRVPPTRIVFARGGSIPEKSRLVSTASEVPTWLVTAGETPISSVRLAELGVRVIVARDLSEAMRTLFSEGIHSLLVEGGAQLAASLLDNDLVDRLTIFRAPIILGSGGLNAFASARPRSVSDAQRMTVLETRICGSDSMTTYAVAKR